MPSAHCVSTIDGIILAADRGFCDLIQRSEAETIGLSYREVTDPRDLSRSASMLVRLESGAAPVRLQKRYIRPDGNSVAANLFVTRFSNPDRLVSTLFWKENGRGLPPARLWEAALNIRHVHETRETLFGRELSTDPVGTLLIGIYLAEAEGRILLLDEIARDAKLLPATASRWIRVLQKRGIVRSNVEPTSGIELTQRGLKNLEHMLAAVYEVADASLVVE